MQHGLDSRTNLNLGYRKKMEIWHMQAYKFRAKCQTL